MAAVRGNGSKFPCPVCLIPDDSMPGLQDNFEARTTQSMQDAYNLAANAKTAFERNEILKGYGLRFVEVSSVVEVELRY